MISRTSTSSILQGFAKSRSFLAGNAAYDPAATWLIATATGTGSSNTITFSSIPSTYKHLQIRGIYKDTVTGAASRAEYRIRFNSSSSGYAYHELIGNGSAASAFGEVTSYIRIPGSGLSSGTGLSNKYGVSIVDIHDYASTTKNTTIRAIAGCDANIASTEYRIGLGSGLWNNTSAVTSIEIFTDGAGNFTSGTTFALYGFTG